MPWTQTDEIAYNFFAKLRFEGKTCVRMDKTLFDEAPNLHDMICWDIESDSLCGSAAQDDNHVWVCIDREGHPPGHFGERFNHELGPEL